MQYLKGICGHSEECLDKGDHREDARRPLHEDHQTGLYQEKCRSTHTAARKRAFMVRADPGSRVRTK